MSATTSAAAWRHVRNVLVVRLDNMGDVLMTTPAMSAIKQSAPDMRVTLLAPGATAAARRYPAERFGAAADVIAKATGCQAVFTGGVDEQALVARAQQEVELPSLSLAGQLTRTAASTLQPA